MTETTICNIELRFGATLFTPPQSDGLLPGVFRQHLLDTGGLRVKSLSVADLAKCDEILIVNSVRGLQQAVLVPSKITR